MIGAAATANTRAVASRDGMTVMARRARVTVTSAVVNAASGVVTASGVARTAIGIASPGRVATVKASGPVATDGERWSEDRAGAPFSAVTRTVAVAGKVATDRRRRARGFRPEGRDGEGRRERPWNNDRREGRGWDASRGERGGGRTA